MTLPSAVVTISAFALVSTLEEEEASVERPDSADVAPLLVRLLLEVSDSKALTVVYMSDAVDGEPVPASDVTMVLSSVARSVPAYESLKYEPLFITVAALFTAVATLPMLPLPAVVYADAYEFMLDT
jgi:hypothetical protein